MAYIQPASECVCGSCPGKQESPPGEWGGFICQCSCHLPKGIGFKVYEGMEFVSFQVKPEEEPA